LDLFFLVFLEKYFRERDTKIELFVCLAKISKKNKSNQQEQKNSQGPTKRPGLKLN